MQYLEEDASLTFKETRPFAFISSASCISFQVARKPLLALSLSQICNVIEGNSTDFRIRYYPARNHQNSMLFVRLRNC